MLAACSVAFGLCASPALSQQASAFPEKGRTISLIVPFAAGGSVDVSARLLAPLMEKELGTTVQVVNRAGAGSQLGINALVRAKPDGYTLAYTILPLTITTYLNPELKAAFARKDLQPLAMHTSDAQYVTVPTASRFKSFKDIIEEARANPEKVTTSATGNYSPEHLAILQLEKAAGIKFSVVFFDGGSSQTTALLGGHIDFQLSTLGNFTSAYKNGQVRFLGVAAREDEPRLEGVDTLDSKGFKIYSYVSRGISVPAGTPPALLDKLSGAIEKSLQSPDHQKSISEMNMTLRYMDPKEMASFWAQMEEQTKPLLMLEVKK
jgi:tripartite-type tricarboxylate transporter receptor subunit TctC